MKQYFKIPVTYKVKAESREQAEVSLKARKTK